MKYYGTIFIFFFFLNFQSSAQEITLENNTGMWDEAESWVGEDDPNIPYNVNGGTVTIRGYITSNDELEFLKGTLIINTTDTLVLYGDLIIGNNADLSIGESSMLIVFGNMEVANKVDIAANGSLVVTGDLNFSGSGNQGSFTSTEDPAQVYVGGDIYLPGGSYIENFPVLECGTGDHEHTDCNYGDLIDAEDSPISDFLESLCTPTPNITSLSSTSPVAVGGIITLSNNSDPGTGGNWPLTYYWTGPSG